MRLLQFAAMLLVPYKSLMETNKTTTLVSEESLSTKGTQMVQVSIPILPWKQWEGTGNGCRFPVPYRGCFYRAAA